MGVFGGFVYGGESVGGDVYGPDVDVLSADLLGADAVRIRLDLPVVVDAAYNDPINYTITRVSAIGQDISIRSVLPIFATTTNEIILVIDKASKGAVYEITLGANLTGTAGQSVVGTAQFTGRRTKIENMCYGLPSHYNVLPDSFIRNVIAAIGIEDDLIGGSLDEE